MSHSSDSKDSPDEAIPLGPMTAQDQFRIEPAFGPKGPTWRATRVA